MFCFVLFPSVTQSSVYEVIQQALEIHSQSLPSAIQKCQIHQHKHYKRCNICLEQNFIKSNTHTSVLHIRGALVCKMKDYQEYHMFTSLDYTQELNKRRRDGPFSGVPAERIPSERIWLSEIRLSESWQSGARMNIVLVVG